MKERYLAIMEKSLSAYSDGHIQGYFDQVKTEGLTEHGFPRLTANIGILIAHGIRLDLTPIFMEMMEFCCKTIPCVKAANDFSVREIVCCIEAVEAAGAVPSDDIARWKSYLAAIEPTACYNVFATSPTEDLRNWALFTAVSEYARRRMGLCDGNMDFIELQLAIQMPWLDENGMYMDNKTAVDWQPIMYDLVSRGLFSILLHFGYRGKYYEKIDAALRKSGLLTLGMQSVTGEMAFGGRSNQFLHNEGWLAAIYEYEANRYLREGNVSLASRFKEAITRAVSHVEEWLEKTPIRHIKNRFPTETKYGCEAYAYFDKYMITTASNFYVAYLMCDESIPAAPWDPTPSAVRTGEHFHKLFLSAGEYCAEFDTNADPHYDACGLGRVHRMGAPSALCLSLPCPKTPRLAFDLALSPFSLCPAVPDGEAWILGADEGVEHEIVSFGAEGTSATAVIRCRFQNGKTVKGSYTVENGVGISLEGEGKFGFALPAFLYDGEKETEITVGKDTLSVTYEGWTCRYTVMGGEILDLDRVIPNRNGHYRAYLAVGTDRMQIGIEIFKA